MEILLLNLKIAGLTLLLSITGCSSDICNQARDVANLAINFVPATTTQAVIPTPTPEPVVVYQQPIAETTQNMVQTNTFSGIILPMDKILIADVTRAFPPTQEKPFGEYIITVSVKENGKSVHNAEITLNNETKKAEGERYIRDLYNNITESRYETFFVYTPESTGDKVLTFTSGDLSKELIINVK